MLLFSNTISDQKVRDIITSRSFDYNPKSILIYKVSDDDNDFHVVLFPVVKGSEASYY